MKDDPFEVGPVIRPTRKDRLFQFVKHKVFRAPAGEQASARVQMLIWLFYPVKQWKALKEQPDIDGMHLIGRFRMVEIYGPNARSIQSLLPKGMKNE